jgi:hypothetical protein
MLVKLDKCVGWWVAAALLLAPIHPVLAAQTGGHRSAIGAATTGITDEPRKPGLGPMSNAEVQGYGCLYTGAAATAIGTFAGSSQLIQVLTGGSIVSVAPLDFALAVTGTIFAGFCAVGALAAPAVVRMWYEYYDHAEVAPQP